ncbi:MAG: hypothetical protein IJK73_07690 [Bacteroidales bacterium]|nr:hypothetical protein [Bacteroidales bacterium]
MASDKILRIFLTELEGTLEDRCKDILRRISPSQRVVEIVFFVDAPSGMVFNESETCLQDCCRSYFGKALPMVTCIAQKPIGATLSAEVLFLRGEEWIEYHGDYLLVRGKECTELFTRGIHSPSPVKVFDRIREILESEEFQVSDIVRQWNYIEGITEVTDGKQNYQVFNDSRSAFYREASWPSGYPAATGIGCASGGVTVVVHAIKGSAEVSIPIDNPIQVPAHRYSGKVLKDGEEAVKTTPKFERARLLGDTVLVSGTAAIKGEDSDFSTDAGKQSEGVIDVMEHLVAPANIFPKCERFHFEGIRVYIKHEEDAPVIASILKDHWKGVPMHFLKADICRSELLLEIEGRGSTRRFLECCCTDTFEAVEAQAGGASRIELCEDLSCGGVTPRIEVVEKVLSHVCIPVNVLVRPRGGDFVYNEAEIEEMAGSIGRLKGLGVNGVVIGALKRDGSVDIPAMERLLEAAEGLHVTFHRAFDECSDPFTALDDIVSLGIERLLTAGHASNVNDGAFTLKELQKAANGRIVIMAGSGVRRENVHELEKLTRLDEFHSTSHGPDGKTARETVADICSV